VDERYLARTLEQVVKRAAREFPAVLVTGPRQSGKTTMLKHLFAGTHRFVSLDPTDVRAAAASDPRGFLAQNSPPVVFDEIQHAPGLLPYLKEAIDSARSERGRFVLTGSQNILLMEKVTESLAGRVAVLCLFPLSLRERMKSLDRPHPWENAGGEPGTTAARPAHGELWEVFLRGGYPEIVVEPERDRALWHSSYVQTYLERDVRTLRQVGDLTLFRNFLRVIAARSAQLLNLTDVARDLGIAVNTAKSWLSILEATYQVIVVRPYHANVGKRLVKTPKVYFADTGTLCHLVGIENPDHAAAGPMAGPIFETAVVSELVKAALHRGEEPRVGFWRTSAGAEVDFVVEKGDVIIPIEVKTSATPNTKMAAGIAALREDLGERVGPGYVVHPGTVRLPLAPGVKAIPFSEL